MSRRAYRQLCATCKLACASRGEFFKGRRSNGAWTCETCLKKERGK